MVFSGPLVIGPTGMMAIIGFREYGCGLRILVIYGLLHIGAMPAAFTDGIPAIGVHMSDFTAA